MAFFKFLLKYCRRSLYLSVIVGLMSGFGLSGIMAVIHRALGGHPEDYLKFLLAFICLWFIYGICCILSEFFLIRMAERVAFRLKLALSHQIFKKKLRELEVIGPHRLFAVLVEDIWMITAFIGRIPSIFINGAICLGCYGYMLWLSPPLFLFNIGFLMIAISLYRIPSNMAKRYFVQAREIYDVTMKQFRSLTEGLKELFIHHRKRRDFLNRHLHASNEEFMKRNIRAMSVYIISRRLGEILVLANIGCLLFVFSRLYKADTHVLTGFILACLFSLSPLVTLLSILSEWVRVNVALEKIQKYGFDLFDADVEERKEMSLPALPRSSLDQLKLEDIRFEYRTELNGDRFVVGPLSFQLKSGQLTFLIGGNGGGKTTLAKIICGLYSPIEGQILWNNEPIDHSNRERFHQNFSVVFSDFFLFQYLIGIDPKRIEGHAEGYLRTLELEEKITIRDGAFSTIDLSYGQRKRLALMAACLEDRPIYIFDEWAAGQAPSFKKVFYEKILMDLKRMNKMVLVITHDENYFPVADQLIKIEDGRLVT